MRARFFADGGGGGGGGGGGVLFVVFWCLFFVSFPPFSLLLFFPPLPSSFSSPGPSRSAGCSGHQKVPIEPFRSDSPPSQRQSCRDRAIRRFCGSVKRAFLTQGLTMPRPTAAPDTLVMDRHQGQPAATKTPISPCACRPPSLTTGTRKQHPLFSTRLSPVDEAPSCKSVGHSTTTPTRRQQSEGKKIPPSPALGTDKSAAAFKKRETISQDPEVLPELLTRWCRSTPEEDRGNYAPPSDTKGRPRSLQRRAPLFSFFSLLN